MQKAKLVLGAARTWYNQKLKLSHRHRWNAVNVINIINAYIWTVSASVRKDDVRKTHFHRKSPRYPNAALIIFQDFLNLHLSFSLVCSFPHLPPFHPIFPGSWTSGALFELPHCTFPTLKMTSFYSQKRKKSGWGLKGWERLVDCGREWWSRTHRSRGGWRQEKKSVEGRRRQKVI